MTNLDDLWWHNIPNASRLCQEVTQNILDGKHVILQYPATMPWRDTFYRILKANLDSMDGKRDKWLIPAREIGNEEDSLGKYFLKEFCKPELRNKFRPGRGYARFLAEHALESTQHLNCLLITDATKEQLDDWIPFLKEYTACLKGSIGCTCCIMASERLDIPPTSGICLLTYEDFLTTYDDFIFTMMAAANQAVPPYLRAYLGELVIAVTDHDVELRAACLSQGSRFMENPWHVLKELSTAGMYSDGRPFPAPPEENVVQSAIWMTQVKLLFPYIEKIRQELLEKYRQGIERLLPHENSLGECITDYHDVEYGLLCHLSKDHGLDMGGNQIDQQKLRMGHNVRNHLAHIDCLTLDEIKQIFGY